MREPINIPQTPITEETFKKQGWRKEHDDNEMEEMKIGALEIRKIRMEQAGCSREEHWMR